MQAVKTNVLGTENVLEAAIQNEVKRVMCLSSDKAVYPIKAMGISKAMMVKSGGFKVDYVIVKGSKTELFPIPRERLKNLLVKLMPNGISRFFPNRCKVGSFLISKISKN